LNIGCHGNIVADDQPVNKVQTFDLEYPKKMNGTKRCKGKRHQVLKRQSNGGNWSVSEIVDVQLNSVYSSKNFCESATKAWASPENQDENAENKSPIDLEDGCDLYKNPFSCCQLRDFFKEGDFLLQLKNELLALSFREKSNDLYQFLQSEDLKKVQTTAVSALKKFLYGDFRRWLISVTGIPLNSTVDMSCAQYNYTDVLLCHDDELEGRRIAYIFYLVDESWEKCDGGSLDLFSVNSDNQPRSIHSSVIPQWNSFAFFAVTPTSFHQVAEVVTKNKCRLSVSGWFHGEPILRPAPFIEPVKNLMKPVDMDEEEFYSWINPTYLNPMTQADIQETFEEKSEIQLHEFISPDKYQALCEALNSSERKWTLQGPANKRHYECTEDDSPVLQEAKRFFQSEAFFLVLSNLTGLKLHHLASTPASSDNESESESVNGEDADSESKTDSKRIKLDQLATASCSGNNKSESQSETRGKPNSKSKKLDQSASMSGDSSKIIDLHSENGEKADSEDKKNSKDINPCCRLQLSRWKAGSYTLLSDEDADSCEYALDVWFFLSADHWQLDHGGQISYIARNEDEELLTVCPSNNCLALVYRDKETMRFTKHINSHSGDLHHFSINGVYYDRHESCS